MLDVSLCLVYDNMTQRTEDPSIVDVAYLARSEHRVPTLVALTERPRSRAELCESTRVSSSTMRRTLDQFVDRNWIRKDGYQYVATRLGEAIATGMADLLELVEIEQGLRDVWPWLPNGIRELPFETWAELTVTVAEPDTPYGPVRRFTSLLQETTTARFLRPEVALMDPCFDELVRLIDEGVDVTVTDRPECHTYFLSTYPGRSSELLDRDNFTVLEHDDLPPYGIGLLDDRVTVSCYEEGTGTVHAVLDTDATAVRDWATSVYDDYAASALPVDPNPKAP